jgi:hypothetical protein
MTQRLAAAALALALAACSGEAPREDEAPAPAPAPAATAAEATASPSPDAGDGRAYRYTELEGCELLRENREEGGFFEHMCPGLGGYQLRLTESDLRQNLAVIAPDGTETGLELGRIGGGGFSTLGGRVEWRGPAEGESFAPDAFVVRFQLAEQPYPAPETSYLLAVRLAPTPCVVGRAAPGPQQNERARTLADTSTSCVAE